MEIRLTLYLHVIPCTECHSVLVRIKGILKVLYKGVDNATLGVIVVRDAGQVTVLILRCNLWKM